jgi:hypothetical protein
MEGRTTLQRELKSFWTLGGLFNIIIKFNLIDQIKLYKNCLDIIQSIWGIKKEPK